MSFSTKNKIMGKFLLHVYNKIAQLTLGQLFEKFFRFFFLVAVSFLVRSCLSFFPFPILLPPKELIDKINLFLCGKIEVVFGADVFTNNFKSLSNLFRCTSSPLEPLPSVSLSSLDSFPQVAAEDCVPSSETKKGFPYKKLLIGGLCVVGLVSALFFFFNNGGGGNLSALETLLQNHNLEQMKLLAEHSVKLQETSVKLDFLIGVLTGLSMRQNVLDENMRAVMEFLNPNGPAF